MILDTQFMVIKTIQMVVWGAKELRRVRSANEMKERFFPENEKIKESVTQKESELV